MSEIRVRFAPSPTGFLHVGGARTAIFNWLFARKNNGKFLLRIEDTDPERSKSELSEQILRTMKWLGMDSDEPIVYQALNMERHKEIALELLKNKKAYYAFESAEELETQRKESQAKKIPFKYNRASLRLDKAAVDKYLFEGRPYAIRFKVPEGETVFDDIVHGQTEFKNSDIDDFIILRSDGSPVYQIAVVVDDYDMNITHVIRGDDHLSNTPKQIMLYKAMGWEVPQFAHLPMILDEEKKKLSKRRNPVAVEEYRDKGYLPDALFNFLTLLGFAPVPSPPASLPKGEGSNDPVRNDTLIKQEIISRNDLIRMFTFDRVNKKSAVFDMKKLNWINSEYIKAADENIIAALINEQLKLSGLPVQNNSYLLNVIHIMKERVSTIKDFTEYGSYFFKHPEKYDDKGLQKHWDASIKDLITKYCEELKSLNEWTPEKLEEHLRGFAEKSSVKAAQLIHPLRLALTGSTVSPGIFELMQVLNKEAVIERISLFLDKN